jgi:hypothetical protein
MLLNDLSFLDANATFNFLHLASNRYLYHDACLLHASRACRRM